MASQIDGLFCKMRFAAATSAWLRVGVSNGADYGQLAASTTAGREVGILQEDVAAAGYGTVKLFAQTYMASITGVPVTRGDVLYRGATGQLSSTGTTIAGIALETVGTNGIIAEVFPTGLI